MRLTTVNLTRLQVLAYQTVLLTYTTSTHLLLRVSDFLMGDVDSGPGLGIPQTKRSRVRHCFCLSTFQASYLIFSALKHGIFH